MEEALFDIIRQMSSLPQKIRVDNADLNSTNIFGELNTKVNEFKSENMEDLLNTLEYLLIRYGKAVYVKIAENKVKDFLPFKNMQYNNSWQVKFVGGFKRGHILLNNPEVGLLDNFAVKDYHNDSNMMWIKSLLEMVCKDRTVPDCAFFVNSERNMPMITRDRAVADFHADVRHLIDFDMPIKQHTVLSFNTSDAFLDIAIPTLPDYQRIEKNMFGVEDFKSMRWEDKETTFLYRGISTAYGVSAEKEPINIRMRLVKLLKDRPGFNVGINWLDTITPIVSSINGEVSAQYIQEDKSLLPKHGLNVISKNKFIFAIDGVGHPEELSMLLFSGSCILKVESEWKSWFYDILEPWIHYVPIDANLCDLEEKTKWCLDNDEQCKIIGGNAREFALRYLSRNGILDYLQKILYDIVPTQDIVEDWSLNYIQKDFKLNYLKETFQRKIPSNDIYYSLSKLNILNNLNWREPNVRLSYGTNYAFSMIGPDKITLIPKNFVYVKTYNCDAEIRGINDAFIGIKCINELTREIPNFCYTYSYYSDPGNTFTVFREFIHNAVTLDIFLQDSNQKKVYEVLIQIFLTLQLSMERCCFEHGRLVPHKILVQTLDKPQKVIYRLLDKSWALDTKYIPVITDYSYAKVLSNFSQYNNKTQRMFIGNYPEKIDENNIENILHVEADRDIKYLLKKIGRNIVRKISDRPSNELQMPMNCMKDIVKKEDIKKNKIRFGAIEEEPLPEENPRLIYDKLIGEENPHDKVYQRIFNHELPQEKTDIGNIILQYELLQSVRSTLVDFNFKFSMDIITSDKLKRCTEFITRHYKKLIEATSNVEFDHVESSLDLFGIKVFIRKYIRLFSGNITSKKIIHIMSSTLKDSIITGISNTIKFYKQYKK